jgi:hypothetical protein
MGRKFDMRTLLQFGPPSPAPAARAVPAKKLERANAEADASSGGAADIQIAESGAATVPNVGSQPSGRRNKHGRRRNKR